MRVGVLFDGFPSVNSYRILGRLGVNHTVADVADVRAARTAPTTAIPSYRMTARTTLIPRRYDSVKPGVEVLSGGKR